MNRDTLVAVGAILGTLAAVLATVLTFMQQRATRKATAAQAERDRQAADARAEADRKATAEAAAAQARKDGTDNLQEDLKDLRDELRTLKSESERRDRYAQAVTRHLENEITSMRSAWPAGYPLPERLTPPRWEDIT